MVTPFPVVGMAKTMMLLGGVVDMPLAVRATLTSALADTVVKTGTAPPLLTVDVAFVAA